MDHAGEGLGGPAGDAAAPAPARPRLAVVNGGLRLADAAAPAPDDWRPAMAAILDWLGVPAQSAAGPAPVFAPWSACCPTAFQNGGGPGLAQAQFVASYAIEHRRAFADPRARGVDMMLLSAHPAAVGSDGLPDAGTMRAMLRAATGEGRARTAILVPARRCAALRAKGLGEGLQIDILSPEEALPLLLADPVRWDAVITMPDQRGMVFALLAEVTGVRGPWPMLWHGREGLVRVTGEKLGAGEGPLPLDATLLTHALTLGLREAGLGAAALRLHTAWAQLRGSGVTTPARGDPAPYATEVPEAEFIALLRHGTAPSRYMVTSEWRALQNQSMSNSGNPTPGLRIVSANLASS